MKGFSAFFARVGAAARNLWRRLFVRAANEDGQGLQAPKTPPRLEAAPPALEITDAEFVEIGPSDEPEPRATEDDDAAATAEEPVYAYLPAGSAQPVIKTGQDCQYR